jgi:hypothetical protein
MRPLRVAAAFAGAGELIQGIDPDLSRRIDQLTQRCQFAYAAGCSESVVVERLLQAPGGSLSPDTGLVGAHASLRLDGLRSNHASRSRSIHDPEPRRPGAGRCRRVRRTYRLSRQLIDAVHRYLPGVAALLGCLHTDGGSFVGLDTTNIGAPSRRHAVTPSRRHAVTPSTRNTRHERS